MRNGSASRPTPLVVAVLIAFAGCAAEDRAAPGDTDTNPPAAPAPAADAGNVADAGISEPEPAAEDTANARAVLLAYYAAIRARDFRTAYGLWSDGGRASGQTYEEFAAGFDDTETTEVHPGPVGPVEGAAGSRYVEIPVTVVATTRDGRAQRFDGSYTLRRSVVDGATADQRQWRIHDADLRRID